MPRRAIWPVLLLLSVCSLYAVDLGRAPIYLHDAEVQFALHARSIATTAHDTNGRLLPLYFQMPSIGENVWFQPVICSSSRWPGLSGPWPCSSSGFPSIPLS